MVDTRKSFKIDFDVDADSCDQEERIRFWDSTRAWFSHRGYTLYECVYAFDEYSGGVAFSHWRPSLGSLDDYKYESPYAHMCGNPPPHKYAVPLSRGLDIHGRILYAQDSKLRHVAMKVMKIDSDEYRVSRFLSQAKSPEGILPILDFLEHDEHCFVVMPGWGDIVMDPWFSTVREVLHFIRTMLKASIFLHDNLIIHRDIKPNNMLVNHFWIYPYNHHRVRLRKEGQLTYALFDFDTAMMLKPGQRRLPCHFSWIGGIDAPDDTSHGELDYDPYAFDVGCLGLVFDRYFEQICPYAPLLAPLIDKMITPRVEDRFTATEALQFLDTLYPQLTEAQLESTPPPKIQHRIRGGPSTRWNGLPQEFVQRWSAYRLPPTPISMKILKRICDPDSGLKLVQWVRLAIRFCGIFFGINESSKLGRF